MKRIVDPDHVIEAVALASGVTADVAAARVRVFRDCVDGLLAHGYSLATWPLYLAHPVTR